MKQAHYDVMILGGSFSGSILAMLLVKRGLKVALLEKGTHPRFAIGESSTPLADLLLRELGKRYGLERLIQMSCYGRWKQFMPEVACGPKRGFAYQFHQEDQAFSPEENHKNELLVSATSSLEVADLQWHRASVDHMLWQQAAENGVDCYSSATGDSHAGKQCVQFVGTAAEGTLKLQLTADWGIDATTAQVSPFDDQPARSKASPLPYQTNTGALFGHVAQLPPWRQEWEAAGLCCNDHPFPIDHSALHQVTPKAWIWQIRFDHEVTSLGMVLAHPQKNGVQSRQQAMASFHQLLQQHPSLSHHFETLNWAAPENAPIWQPRIQRLRQRNSGERWFSLPMAIGFVDPLHSTGIAHALWGIAQVVDCWESWSQNRFTSFAESFTHQVQQELLHVDRLVQFCYQHLGDAHRFTLGTLAYFAAATQLEKQWLAGKNVFNSGFLLANNAPFCTAIQSYGCILNDPHLTEDQCWERCRSLLQPFDQVGLFAPAIPRMYAKTTAE